jgi:type IV pilus assembly protein PilN
VILINLLPHREEKRKRRRTAYYIGLGASAVAGVIAVGVWFAVLESMKSSQEERNAFLGSEIKKLEAQIKDIANLRAEIDALKARQKAVEDLQADRNVPVHLLNELVKQTPEGVYLTSIKQAGQVVTVIGLAQTNERVSEFLRNTLYSSPWLEKPELIEIRVAAAAQGRPTSSRLYDFSMRVSVKRPQQPADAASAPPANKTAAVAKAS